jgi:peptidoglycan/xylan/chitin deacetylase (PgdA/CDA1 family)
MDLSSPEVRGPTPYRPVTEAPKLVWPGGAVIAVWIIPNIEWYGLDRPISGSRSNSIPDVRAWSTHEYGARVGVFRLMDALDRVGARATVALNALVCDMYPQIIEAGNQRGWEWMGHGLLNAQPLVGLKEEEERDIIGQTLDRIEAGTGRRPRGWLGPGLEESFATAGLLAAAGLTYVADWVMDDRPFLIESRDGQLVSVPYSLVHNDTRMYDQTVFTPSEYRDQMCKIFDVLYQEGEASATVMAIPLHPHLSGFPARAYALGELLNYIKRHGRVWWATGSEIADAYLDQVGLSTGPL